MPRKCPVCGAEVVRAEGEVAYRCIGLSCPAKLKQALRFFGARGALDVEGLGEKLVDQLVDRGLVRDVADLYGLDAETPPRSSAWARSPPPTCARSSSAASRRRCHTCWSRSASGRWARRRPRRWPSTSGRSSA